MPKRAILDSIVSRIAAWSLVAALSLAACTASSPTEPPPEPTAAADVEAVGEDVVDRAASLSDPALRAIVVALGDAYTHGTATTAPRRDSWPAQVAESVERSGYTIILRNLAEPSVASDGLLELQLPQVESLSPDVVTLQVGVNDIIYPGHSEWYRDNIAAVFDELLTILPPARILAITTPDHTLTEWGQMRGSPEAEHEAVQELNATLREVARDRDIEVIDIGPVNSLVATDSTLVVQDDPPVPYPTAKQYAGWAELIGPYVHDALSTLEP